jgi:chorismate dehydratase
MNPIRIGKISFTNILPIYHYFDDTGLPIEWIPQVPTQLNRGMAEGKIDMGPISSFAYAEQYPNYVLLPNLSVSATGPVGSIFLFTRGKRLSELKTSKIALTNTSASSVNLLKILLEGLEGGRPSYVTMAPDLTKMMEEADAALLIGDDAIRAKWANPGYTVLDLGEEWHKRTGKSMTFAVWAVRKEVAETRKEELSQIYRRFVEAKERSGRELGPVVQEAMRQLGGDPPFWQAYFQGLTYDFSSSEIEGLTLYYRWAKELGLISTEVTIEVLDINHGE